MLTYISPESLPSPFFHAHSFQFMCEDSRGVPLSPLSPRFPFWPVGPWIPGSPFAPFFPSTPGGPWGPVFPGLPGLLWLRHVHHGQVLQEIPAFHVYQVGHLSRVVLHSKMEKTVGYRNVIILRTFVKNQMKNCYQMSENDVVNIVNIGL